MTREKILRRAFTATLPVMAGYLVLGTGFGILLRVKGYGVPWALGMSLFIYAGSMQFAAIPLLTEEASLLTAALTTLLVNARHLFYGISMLSRYREAGREKPYLIFALTDETYSLLGTERELAAVGERRRYDLYVSALDHTWWVTGSVIGSLAGRLIPFSTEGIDFALTALFLTVVTDQVASGKHRLSSLTGAGTTLLCLLLFGPDGFLLPSMAGILLILFLLRGKEERI